MKLVKKFLSLVVAGSLLMFNCGFLSAKETSSGGVTTSQATKLNETPTKNKISKTRGYVYAFWIGVWVSCIGMRVASTTHIKEGDNGYHCLPDQKVYVGLAISTLVSCIF